MITKRKIREDDLNFIRSSMLKSIRHSVFSSMTTTDFYEVYNPIVNNIIQNSEVDLLVLTEGDDTILAYIVYQPDNILHFIYTKHIYRQKNLATKLFLEAGFNLEKAIQCSHDTSVFKKHSKKRNLVFKPFLLDKYKGVK